MKPQTNFIVIDTEGQPILKAMAIVDHQGNLIYEAFDERHCQNPQLIDQSKPLKTIVNEFLAIAGSQTIICHYARHDMEVLRNTFRAVGVRPPRLSFQCSFELAQRYLPQLGSNSLQTISKQLNLSRDDQTNNRDFLHRAKHDALFTYQLYRRMINELLKTRLQHQPNPFGTSRVDTPFQSHIDFRAIFDNEFERLKHILSDIKNDVNHQSKGAVVIGEPGSGKTHLMMRLAQDLLTKNRLLFIRQPNNPDTVLFHTYSRILESLIQTVPDSSHTQLEYLLANSFAQIIKNTQDYATPTTQKDERLIELIKADNLKLFTDLGKEDTRLKREYWQHIEKRAYDWWINQFSSAGYAPKILKGIIRFCGYTDFKRRQTITQWLAMNDVAPEELEKVGLESWGEDTSREEISLAALAVFSKLSLLDEPLIIIFDQLEGLGQKHNERLLQSFGEAVKEIFTHVPNSLIILNLFPDRWLQFQQVFDGSIIDRISQSQIILNKPSNEQLKQLLDLKAQVADVTIDELFEPQEIADILTAPSIRSVVNAAADYYRYKIDGICLPQRPDKSGNSGVIGMMEKQIHQLREEVAELKFIVSKLVDTFNLADGENIVRVFPNGMAVRSPINSSRRSQLEDYLRQQRGILEQNYGQPAIISESDDFGKLKMIIESLKLVLSPLSVDILRLGKRVLPEHLVIKTATHQFAIAFLHQSGTRFYHRMRNLNELVSHRPDIHFNLCRDAREDLISGKSSKIELEKFCQGNNSHYLLFDRDQRITFELIYQAIVDIQNRDLEIDLPEALDILLLDYQDYWLFQNLTQLTLDG
ncbi:exonuclease domain-containing protein [Arthrospira platensis BEA 1257B]